MRAVNSDRLGPELGGSGTSGGRRQLPELPPQLEGTFPLVYSFGGQTLTPPQQLFIDLSAIAYQGSRNPHQGQSLESQCATATSHRSEAGLARIWGELELMGPD